MEKGTCTDYDVINLRAMVALGTVGHGTEIIFGASEEYSLSYFRLKFLCITVVPCVFLCNHTGTLQKTFWMGASG